MFGERRAQVQGRRSGSGRSLKSGCGRSAVREEEEGTHGASPQGIRAGVAGTKAWLLKHNFGFPAGDTFDGSGTGAPRPPAGTGVTECGLSGARGRV